MINEILNPSNAEANCIQKLKDSKKLKPFQTLSCWYSLALADYSQISTHVQGFQSVSALFASFCIVSIATSSIKG